MSASSRSFLLRLTLLAFVLRVAAALLWAWALPRWGYGTPPELAGYVMADAYTRDTAAWRLAQSSRPLTDAFGYARAADQYGGLLFLSAAVYRYLGGPVHQPLLLAALLAALSSLSVPLAWAFVRRVWGGRAARWTAWGLAVYPEAVLLGSAHMREALAVPLVALGLYGAVLAAQGRRRGGIAGMGAAVLLAAPLSPPVAATVLTVCGLTYLALEGWAPLRRRRVQAALAVLMLLGAAVVWRQGGGLAVWVQRAAQYQGYLSRQASGWVQRTFRVLPAWTHLPFLMLYGVLRPLLPAALLAGGAPVWWGIAIWRALGWSVLLAALGLAALRVAQERQWLRLPGVWLALVLLQALAASLRGGGDLWDNPRYRAVLSVPQVALAVWGLLAQRERPSKWAARLLRGAALGVLWLLPWYVRRYTPLDWAVVSLFKTLALGAATLVLYAVADWAQDPA